MKRKEVIEFLKEVLYMLMALVSMVGWLVILMGVCPG